MFIVLNSCLLYPIMIIQPSYNIYRELKYTKNLKNVLNKNVNETKRARSTTFAMSIVDNLCLLPTEYTWNTIKIRIPRLLNHHSAIRIKFHGHS